jgi:hypothetical protein
VAIVDKTYRDVERRSAVTAGERTSSRHSTAPRVAEAAHRASPAPPLPGPATRCGRRSRLSALRSGAMCRECVSRQRSRAVRLVELPYHWPFRNFADLVDTWGFQDGPFVLGPPPPEPSGGPGPQGPAHVLTAKRLCACSEASEWPREEPGRPANRHLSRAGERT